MTRSRRPFGKQFRPGFPDTTGEVVPTLREVLQGYNKFNAWEFEEQQRRLPQLAVTESLTLFFELCDLMRLLAPGVELVFLEQDQAHWIALRKRFQQAAEVMGSAKTTRSIA